LGKFPFYRAALDAATLLLAFCVVAATLVGVLAAWVDLHNTEVAPAIVLIVSGGIVLGFIDPRHAWVLGAIIGGAIPTAHILARILSYPVPYPVELPFTFLAVVVGVIAALIGAKIRPVLDDMLSRAQ
jgi:hypothetical protein